MAREFPADPDISFTSLQAVDGADVVEASAGDVVPRGGVCTSHHPGRAQGDGMYLGRKKGFGFNQKPNAKPQSKEKMK